MDIQKEEISKDPYRKVSDISLTERSGSYGSMSAQEANDLADFNATRKVESLQRDLSSFETPLNL